MTVKQFNGPTWDETTGRPLATRKLSRLAERTGSADPYSADYRAAAVAAVQPLPKSPA